LKKVQNNLYTLPTRNPEPPIHLSDVFIKPILINQIRIHEMKEMKEKEKKKEKEEDI